MEGLRKSIHLDSHKKHELADEFKISNVSVQSALNFITQSDLAKSIRSSAFKKGGVIYNPNNLPLDTFIIETKDVQVLKNGYPQLSNFINAGKKDGLNDYIKELLSIIKVELLPEDKKDIAYKCGVTHQTVSNSLTGHNINKKVLTMAYKVAIENMTATNKVIDPLFNDAARMVVSAQKCSQNMIQLYFMIGFNRAERIIKQLEEAKIVGTKTDMFSPEVLVKDLIELAQIIDKCHE